MLCWNGHSYIWFRYLLPHCIVRCVSISCRMYISPCFYQLYSCLVRAPWYTANVCSRCCVCWKRLRSLFSAFSVFHLVVVAPVRELAGRHAEITATVLQDADVYDDSQRAELSVDDNDVLPGSFRMLCYLPLTDQPLRAGDRIKANVGFYLPAETEGFDRATYQASNRCYIAASYTETEEGQAVSFAVTSSEGDHLRWLPQRIARFCKQAVEGYLPAREAGLLSGLLIGDTAHCRRMTRLRSASPG